MYNKNITVFWFLILLYNMYALFGAFLKADWWFNPNCTEQSHSWEHNSSLTSKKKVPTLCETWRINLIVTQKHSLISVQRWIYLFNTVTLFSFIYVLILSSHLCLGLSSDMKLCVCAFLISAMWAIHILHIFPSYYLLKIK